MTIIDIRGDDPSDELSPELQALVDRIQPVFSRTHLPESSHAAAGRAFGRFWARRTATIEEMLNLERFLTEWREEVRWHYLNGRQGPYTDGGLNFARAIVAPLNDDVSVERLQSWLDENTELPDDEAFHDEFFEGFYMAASEFIRNEDWYMNSGASPDGN